MDAGVARAQTLIMTHSLMQDSEKKAVECTIAQGRVPGHPRQRSMGWRWRKQRKSHIGALAKSWSPESGTLPFSDSGRRVHSMENELNAKSLSGPENTILNKLALTGGTKGINVRNVVAIKEPGLQLVSTSPPVKNSPATIKK